QVETAVIGVAALQQRDDKNALKLSKIEGELGSLGSAVKENLNCLKRKEPTSSARVGTPSPEKGSNSLFGHPSDDSLDHADSLINETPSLQVEMLDNRGKELYLIHVDGVWYSHDIVHELKYMCIAGWMALNEMVMDPICLDSLEEAEAQFSFVELTIMYDL
ncbi:hypothetical protein C5167_012254, partial [Papaver somniferum]